MIYDDIYFNEEYGKLYEIIGDGKLQIFETKSEIGSIKNMFIKREIPVEINGIKYFDITTPYGYGGPIIVDCKNPADKKQLLNDYYRQFKDYCVENNIISEFIRFHPINQNYLDFKEIYTVEFDRKTVGTALKRFADPIQKEFKKDCKRRIRKALKLGAKFEVIKSPADLSHFRELYYQTMDRNSADCYYYFEADYFKAIINNLKDQLLLVNVLVDNSVIASELYFVSAKLMHAHLAVSLLDYPDFSPSCLLEYAAVLWGKENKYDYIHHGGGRTPKEDDALLRFKRNFGVNTEFDFYRGKKIWNKAVYDQLCTYYKIDQSIDYFPAYRKK